MERDLLGEKEVPGRRLLRRPDRARAGELPASPESPINHYPGFVEAWAIVKLAAARANTDVGAMKPERLGGDREGLRGRACDGKYHDQFLVDWYQGGAGTSTNMNANEVLANVALELTGHKKGEYKYRRAARRPEHVAVDERLLPDGDQGRAHPAQRQADRGAASSSSASFRAKGNAYLEIVKMGRTELQDAVPMTVGQEFHAFAAVARRRDPAAADAEKYLYAVNMGATAIGTGTQRAQGLRREVRRRTWPSSPASRSSRPPTCSRRPGTSRASSSTRRRSRAWRSSSRRSRAT